MLLLGIALRERLSTLQTACLLSLPLLSPNFVYSASTVTNDASAIAAGALCLLVLPAPSFPATRRRVAACFGVGSAVALLKTLFLFAPFALLIGALLARGVAQPRTRGADLIRRCRSELTLFAGAVAATAAWTALQQARATVSPATVTHALLGFTEGRQFAPHQIAVGFRHLLSAFLLRPIPGVPTVSLPGVIYYAWDIAVFAYLASLLLRRPREPAATAAGVLISLLALAVSWSLINFLQGHYLVNAQRRYALPLLPLVALVVAKSGSRRSNMLLGTLIPGAAIVTQLLVIGY
jgi:hypothetical protein